MYFFFLGFKNPTFYKISKQLFTNYIDGVFINARFPKFIWKKFYKLKWETFVNENYVKRAL